MCTSRCTSSLYIHNFNQSNKLIHHFSLFFGTVVGGHWETRNLSLFTNQKCLGSRYQSRCRVQKGTELNDFQRNLLDIEILSNLRSAPSRSVTWHFSYETNEQFQSTVNCKFLKPAPNTVCTDSMINVCMSLYRSIWCKIYVLSCVGLVHTSRSKSSCT